MSLKRFNFRSRGACDQEMGGHGYSMMVPDSLFQARADTCQLVLLRHGLGE